MGRMTINGQTFEVPDGHTINVIGNNIVVAGNTVVSGLTGVVKIVWDGPAASIKADGNVECGDVQGDVTAGGNVRCGNIGGNVEVNGSAAVKGKVSGRITAGGSVNVSG